MGVRVVCGGVEGGERLQVASIPNIFGSHRAANSIADLIWIWGMGVDCAGSAVLCSL